jgi:excisionase family DNA binding protein
MEQHTITQIYNTTLEDFRDSLKEDRRKELQELAGKLAPKPVVEYLTRKEVSKKLKIGLSTVSEWDKVGILKPYRLGNLVRYKSDEIDAALIAISK